MGDIDFEEVAKLRLELIVNELEKSGAIRTFIRESDNSFLVTLDDRQIVFKTCREYEDDDAIDPRLDMNRFVSVGGELFPINLSPETEIKKIKEYLESLAQ